MAESQTVTILRAKREDIAAAIQNYKRQLERSWPVWAWSWPGAGPRKG
jgi:hypothetical protein